MSTYGPTSCSGCVNGYDGTGSSEIRLIQESLVGHGYLERSSITGVYGTKTYNAVVEFQTDRGMSVDGRVGPDTLSVISVPALPAVSPPREAASPPEASILQPPKKLSDEAWFWPAVMGSGAALAIGLALYLRGRK